MKHLIIVLAAALLIACGQPDAGARPKPTFANPPGTPTASGGVLPPATPAASAPLIRIVYMPLITKDDDANHSRP